MGSNSPMPWNPRSAASSSSGDVPGKTVPGGNVAAGDWCCVFVSYRSDSASRVIYTPGYFLIHAVYTPNSDDGQPHGDQATMYGGSSTASNRRRNYHVNVGTWFQVPFDGQVSVVAGGDSDPDLFVDVLFVRGFSPRDLQSQYQALENMRQQAVMGDVEALYQLSNFSPVSVPRAQTLWAPPIVGVPQLYPATWVDLQAAVPIPFTDGVSKISAVGAAGTHVRFAISVMGNALALDAPPGIPVDVGAYGQGFASSDGTVSTWAPTVALQTATLYTSLGG